MRHIPALLPYALASMAVVLASAIAVGTTVRPGGAGPGASPAGAEPTPAVRPVTAADARMTYWRAAASGQLELWVSDLDGDHRSRIATAGADTEIALTRWSPDGTAVAYTIGGTSVGMAWLDATGATLAMPAQLRSARWRIVSFEWSSDAKRLAATFRAGGGLSNESDVWVAEARGSATWERATTTGDSFAGRWIDADRLFVETSSGMIGVLDLTTRALRPITAMPATSPLVGRDGRVYFTGGRSVVADVATGPVANGWVWSVTADGEDLRRETAAEQQQVRLFGVLADGRAVTGVPGGMYFAGDALVPLAFVGTGTLRRVVLSDDGKRAIAVSDSRILQIDAAKIPRALPPGSPLPPANAATILLSGLRDADVWTARKAVALARSALLPVQSPQARLAFVLGRTLWQADPGGGPRPVLSEPVFFISPPRWSPSGDRLAAIVTSGSPARATLIVAGRVTKRWDLPALAPALQWSPDGASLAMWSPAGQRTDEWTTQVYDAETGVAGERIAGRAQWTSAGRIVLSDGDQDPAAGGRTGQRVELVEGSARRTVTDAGRLAADPLLRDLPNATAPAAITQIVPLGDPAYTALSLSRVRQGGIAGSAWVVVRVSDGAPVWSFATDPRLGIVDVTPSPAGHLLGWSVISDPATSARSAALVDPVAGSTTVLGPGRFGGWSPDGQWAYVARDEGLYAYPVRGGEPVKVSALGVAPVAATRP